MGRQDILGDGGQLTVSDAEDSDVENAGRDANSTS